MRYSTIAMLFMAGNAIAQPVLDNSVSTPQGTVADFFQVPVQALLTAGTGANQNWNFSSLDTTNANTSTESYISPNGLPGAANFPTANAATNQQGAVTFYLVTPQKIDLLGFHTASIQMVYSNPEERFRFPLTFNQSYTDAFAATDLSPNGVVRSGNLTNTFVGYGNLTMPGGQVLNNVIRMDQQYTVNDTYGAGGSSFTFTSTLNTQYYLVPGIAAPVVLAISSTSQGQTSNNYLVRRNYTLNTSDIQAIAATLYPNPASSQSHVLFTAPETGPYNVIVTDIQGRTVQTLNGEATTGETILQPLSLKDVPAGIYQVQLSQGNLNAQYKLVVQ
jgi:hypothetical protein